MKKVKKETIAQVKLQIPAGKANPAPPVGSVLGQYGLNIMDFCKQFNAQTASMGDTIVPVIITVYQDRTFSFIRKTPPVSVLIKQACKIKSGSKMPQKDKVAQITPEQVRKIAEKKMADLNSFTIEQAESQVIGTARSMGIEVS